MLAELVIETYLLQAAQRNVARRHQQRLLADLHRATSGDRQPTGAPPERDHAAR
jgi:hypothetical protein